MKTKEEILKEFDELFGLTDNNFPKEIPAKPFETYQDIRRFLIKALAQTREETIREVEGALPKEKKLKEYEKTDPNVLTEANLRNLKVSFENQAIAPYVSAYNTVRQEVLDILNKLKK